MQEEERLKQDKTKNAHLASISKDNRQSEKESIKLLRIQYKRNNIRMKIVASFVICHDMSSGNV